MKEAYKPTASLEPNTKQEKHNLGQHICTGEVFTKEEKKKD